MLRALIELGNQLEKQGDLQPVGFYEYGEPIRWIVNIWPERSLEVALEGPTDIHKSRPYSGRTSGIQAHPVADEAAYALGINRKPDGKQDKHAQKKHESFRQLLEECREYVQDSALQEALIQTEQVLEEGQLHSHPSFPEITAKDWVSFKVQSGALADQHLFEHFEIRRFWIEKSQQLVAQRDKAGRAITGECAICGVAKPLIRMIPLNVKLNKTTPIHSLNEDTFVSFIKGHKDAHIGLCFECADTASRAFNYLSSKHADRHRKTLIRDTQKNDSLKNQIALFWLKPSAAGESSSIEIGERSYSLEQMLHAVTDPLGHESRTKEAASSEIEMPQLRALLNYPWKPQRAALSLDAWRFLLAIWSPNGPGRITLREWIDASLPELKESLNRYVDALSIIMPSGREVRDVSIRTLFNALTPSGSRSPASNPAVLRGLLHCAYLKQAPPPALLDAAVHRFRVPTTHEDAWRLHALAAAMKLVLTHEDPEEAKRMQRLDKNSIRAAYLYGRQLAIVERAQEYSQWLDHQERSQSSSGEDESNQRGTNATLVERFYGGASSTPGTVMPQLYRLFEMAYLPKIRNRGKGTQWLIKPMSETSTQLKALEDRPFTLGPREQAEFALGFYCQRADFRKPKDSSDDEENPSDEGGQS